MEESLTIEQILDDLSKAKSDDPVFTIGTKNSSLSDDIRKFIKQQTELQELKETVATELDKTKDSLPRLLEKEAELNSLTF
jgi:hypothetical protein